MKKNKVTRTLLIVGGSVSVVLAVLGMFFPILPTTPFLLLAAVCYAHSSKEFYHWLMTNRWFGAYIRNYRAGLGIPLKQKILTLILLWLTIGYSAFILVPYIWLKVILVGIAIGVSIHLVKTRTYHPESQAPGSLTEVDSPDTLA